MNFKESKIATISGKSKQGDMWEFKTTYREEKKCYAHYKYTLALTRRQTSNPPRDDIIADAECLKVCDCLTEAEAAELKDTPNWADTFNIPVVNGQVMTTFLYDIKQTKCECTSYKSSDAFCEGTYTIPIWSGTDVTSGLSRRGSYRELLAALESDLKSTVMLSELIDDPVYAKCCPDE